MKKLILYKRDYVIVILLVIFVVLSSVEAYYKNKTSTLGLTASEIQSELKELQLQNELLKAEIYYGSSYRVIQQRAIESGLTEVPNSNWIYVK